jgi:hypothetical protein
LLLLIKIVNNDNNVHSDIDYFNFNIAVHIDIYFYYNKDNIVYPSTNYDNLGNGVYIDIYYDNLSIVSISGVGYWQLVRSNNI